MRRGQRASSSSESEENHRPWSKNSKDRSSPRGRSSEGDSSSESDVEAERAMKRSQRFSSSFSFGEDQEAASKNKGEEAEPSPKNSNRVSVREVVESDSEGEHAEMEERNSFCDTDQPRSGLFRPQELWLAVTKCLSLRWPPCLSISRQSNKKLAYQVDLDQLEDTQSSVTSESTNESSSSTSTSDGRDVSSVKQKEDDVRSRGVKSGPPTRRGVSRSSPRLPRSRQAADSVLASMMLEKEMFLRIELVDSGEERDDLRYRAEWKLSERTKELAEGVWLSRPLTANRLTS